MQKAFSQIDLFGKAVLFTYRGNSKSKSKVGAFMTLALFGFIIWLVYYFGKVIFEKSSPKANSFESFDGNPPLRPLNTDTFPLGFSLENPDTYDYFINESLYTVHAYTYKTTREPQDNGTTNIISEQIDLEVEACTPAHFGDLADSFAYVALDQMYCLKKVQPNLNGSDIPLEGTWESPVFQNVFIEILACNNTTSEVPCGTQEEMKNMLEGGYLGLVYPNLAIDVTDNKQPVKKFRDGFYTTSGVSFSKDIVIQLQNVEIETDSGWLTKNSETENYIKLESMKETSYTTSKGYMLTMSIRLANVIKHYSRSYTKVQEVVAQVNGIATLGFTVLFITLAPYARLKFYEALINEIFDIKLKNKPKSKNSRRKLKKRNTSQNIKKNENKNPTPNQKQKQQFTSNADLEQQNSALSSDVLALSDAIEFENRKNQKDHNQANVCGSGEYLVSPNENRDKPNYSLMGAETPGPNKHVEFDQIRSEGRLFSSESPSREDNPEININIGIESPLPLDRKPKFLRPNFKVVEDVLESPPESQVFDNKVEIDEVTIADKEQKTVNYVGVKRRRSNINSLLLEREVSPEKTQHKKVQEKVGKTDRTKDIQKPHPIVIPRNSDEIDLSFWEYIRSFFSKSDAIKEKLSVLNEGIKRIDATMDIFNLFKMLGEFDKFKVLMMDNEKLTMFNSLPRPILTMPRHDISIPLSISTLKDSHQLIQDKVLLSLENLKRKSASNLLG